MNSLPPCRLAIRPASAPVRPACAWFIPMTLPQEWLQELLTSGADLTTTRLCLLPANRQNLDPSGVLVIPTSPDQVRFSRRCQAYGRVGKRLYLPINAIVSPPLAETEIDQLVSRDGVSVLHPGLGLVVIEAEQELRTADLLEVPATESGDWSRAHPGLALPRKLVSVEPISSLSVEEMLIESRGDIGTQSQQLQDLPPGPSEPGNSFLTEIPRAMGRQFAKFVLWVTSGASRTASEPTFVDRMEQWAANQLKRLGLETERQREVQRLIDLLEQNPDEGLKYALPMGGLSRHRGVAPPSSQLVKRDVNFDLGRMGGSGPADFWDIPPETQQQLIRQYRDLANRELRLGRHRRAAYIFAELLNDVTSAASALVAGHHWREVALLYKERLQRPWDAAIYYQKGGLWSEAIQLYEELGAFEHIGDLHKTLGQTELAEEAFERAVARCRKGNDHIGASRIREKKLNDVDGALLELADGWPNSAQAALCLTGTFRLLGSLGRHSQAQELLTQLQTEPVLLNQRCPLVETLGGVAQSYPDPIIRTRVADAVRVLTARMLPDLLLSSERDRLLRTVASLVPQDRLLGRDCQRYRPPAPEPIQLPKQPRNVDKAPVLTGVIKLPPFINWRTITAGAGGFFATGYKERELVVLRSRWDGFFQFPLQERWNVSSQRANIVMCPPLLEGQKLFVQPEGEPGLQERRFPQAYGFSSELRIGGMSTDTIAASRSSSGVVCELTCHQNRLFANWINEETFLGQQEISFLGVPIGQPIPIGQYSPPSLCSASDLVYMGYANDLVWCFTKGEKKHHVLPDVIRQLQLVSPVGAPIPLLVTFAHGGGLTWSWGELVQFSEDLENAVFGTAPGGWIIADNGQICRVHRLQKRRVTIWSEIKKECEPPLAVLSMGEAGRFAIARPNGEIELYRVDP